MWVALSLFFMQKVDFSMQENFGFTTYMSVTLHFMGICRGRVWLHSRPCWDNVFAWITYIMLRPLLVYDSQFISRACSSYKQSTFYARELWFHHVHVQSRVRLRTVHVAWPIRPQPPNACCLIGQATCTVCHLTRIFMGLIRGRVWLHSRPFCVDHLCNASSSSCVWVPSSYLL